MRYALLTEADAPALWALMDRLDHQTQYMLYEPGERHKDLSRVQAAIRSAQEGDFLLAAYNDSGEPIGYLSAQRGGVRRTQHCAYIVVGILPAYGRQGIGTELFCRAEQWARAAGVTRLELSVVCDNTAAVGLYEKCGFDKEGLRKNAMVIGGAYADEWYMAKILK